jgi:hypothetical protein
VGAYYPTNSLFEGRRMIVPESDGTWAQAVPLDAPAGATYAWLEGVSCPAAGPCVGVGIWGDQTDSELPLAYAGEPPATEPAQTGSSTVKVTTIGSPGGGAAVPTCSISLKGTSIRVNRTHAAQVRLTDTGAGACTGTVSLSIPIKARGEKAKARPKKAKSRKLGAGSLRLAAGETTTVAVRLNGAGKKALAKAAGRLKGSLTVDAGNARIVEAVQLRAARPKRRAKHRGRSR